MRTGKRTFIIALLVLVTGLFGGRFDHGRPSSPRIASVAGKSLHFSDYHRHFVSFLIAGTDADHSSRRGEKRHGKSLISQAIVADAPVVVRPYFTYCQHNYSLFLPPGCISQFIGEFPLRGPPALV